MRYSGGESSSERCCTGAGGAGRGKADAPAVARLDDVQEGLQVQHRVYLPEVVECLQVIVERLERSEQRGLELRGGELAQVVLERRLERERLVDVAVQPRQLLRRGARGSGGGEALGVVEEA